MKKIKQFALAALLITSALAGFASTTPVQAALDPCDIDPASQICADKPKEIDNVFKTIINVLLFVVGAIAVIVIIVSGIRYATSGGNATNVTAAKNTLLYAVIGLVVAIFAWAIVNWVFGVASTGNVS